MVYIFELFIFFTSSIITTTFYLVIGKFFLLKKKNNFFDYSIYGLIVVSSVALFLNFISPLSKELNTLIQILTFIFYFFIFKKRINFSEMKLIIVISFSILLLVSFDTEYRPDAYLYHLPFSQILNEYKIIPGLSNLHFRFGHVSIFQYISSFNYTILSGHNGLLIPPAFFCITIFFYFLNDTYSIVKQKKISYGKLFSFIILVYIGLRINRYGEFGNDAMAHLSIFYLISKFIYLDSSKIDTYKKILFFSVFSFLNKSFMIFTFFIPAYLFFKTKLNYKTKLLNFSIFFLVLWLVKNIFISGCAIYPVKYSCIENLKWVDIKDVSYESTKGEAWAKAWPQNQNKNLTQLEFNKEFNWIEAWLIENKNIFIKKLSPFVIFLVSFVLFFRGTYLINRIKNQKQYILLLFSTIGTIYFFIKFPTYRYGYSYLIVLISILTLNIFSKVNYEKIFKLIKFTLIVLLVGLILKNSQRILKYYDTRSILPNDRYLSKTEQDQVQKIFLSKEFYYYLLPGRECRYFKSPCTHIIELGNLKSKKIFNYNIILKRD